MSRSYSEFRCVPISQIPLGTKLREPIFDARTSGGKDLLLLASGQMLSQATVDQLVKRGVSEVRVSLRELQRLEKAKSRENMQSNPEIAAAVKRAAQEELRDAIEKFGITNLSHFHQLKQHGNTGFNADRLASFQSNYEESSEQLNSLLGDLCKGTLPNGKGMVNASEASIDQISEDMDLVVAMGISPAANTYSSRHSLQTAMLAMSIGTSLGLKREQLVELGIGCLVHDAGMQSVPQELVHARRKLNAIEFLEITKHPSTTFALLQCMTDIPTGSRMVAYQMHERFDGSGYPRQRRGAQIHPLARIAMVADVFVAMVSPRPYRPPILPYKVMEFILHCTKLGHFDPDVIRGLLQTTSLFPIGSYVALKDGRVGKVVRAHRELFNRPMVEIQSQVGTEKMAEIVNTATAPGVEIVQALPKPPIPLTAASVGIA